MAVAVAYTPVKQTAGASVGVARQGMGRRPEGSASGADALWGRLV